MVNLSASVNTFKDIDPVSIMKQVIISPTRLISFKLNFKLSKPFLTNQCIMMSQSGQFTLKILQQMLQDIESVPDQSQISCIEKL